VARLSEISFQLGALGRQRAGSLSRILAAAGLRTPEYILAIYLSYTSILALALHLDPRQRSAVLTANLCVGLAYTILLLVRGWWGGLWNSVARDWAPLAVVILCYKQMGWFAQAQQAHTMERNWVAWDRLLLHEWGLKAAVESLGPVLPTVLELCYLLVYALPPFMVAMLYVYRRRNQVDAFLTIYIIGICLAYGQFPFWPSEPPRTLFAGADLPAVTTFFRRMSLLMLGSQGIHTSVFPSAHVSSAFAAAFAAQRILPDKFWLRWGVLVYACLVATATVYGRYHYAVDGAAGFLCAVAAYTVGTMLLGRPARLENAAPDQKNSR
jgi:membrane-associated phospholipid phosphatase